MCVVKIPQKLTLKYLEQYALKLLLDLMKAYNSIYTLFNVLQYICTADIKRATFTGMVILYWVGVILLYFSE